MASAEWIAASSRATSTRSAGRFLVSISGSEGRELFSSIEVSSSSSSSNRSPAMLSKKRRTLSLTRLMDFCFEEVWRDIDCGSGSVFEALRATCQSRPWDQG